MDSSRAVVKETPKNYISVKVRQPTLFTERNGKCVS